MKYLVNHAARFMVAGALLSLGAPMAYADDAGTHDFFLSGSTAGSNSDQQSPSQEAAPAVAVPDHHAMIRHPHSAARREAHYASKTMTKHVAAHETPKSAVHPMHAHVRDLKDEKTRSSS